MIINRLEPILSSEIYSSWSFSSRISHNTRSTTFVDPRFSKSTSVVAAPREPTVTSLVANLGERPVTILRDPQRGCANLLPPSHNLGLVLLPRGLRLYMFALWTQVTIYCSLLLVFRFLTPRLLTDADGSAAGLLFPDDAILSVSTCRR